jgi:4-hydroxy-tetrahydrodipicolinate reductase
VIKVALFGAGRMAQAFAEQVRRSADLELTAVVARNSPEWTGGIAFCNRLDELPLHPQLLVDFTLPDGTAEAAAWCARNKVALLSGVTGLQDEQFETLEQAAREVAVLWSPNLSLGINLLARLAREASAALPPATRVHIDDVHHRHKKDAPSGTALFLGEAVRAGRAERDPGYSSERIGEVIGKHSITFSWEGEEISLAHAAKDRSVFARGALSAAVWLARQPAGNYRAEDWLGG